MAIIFGFISVCLLFCFILGVKNQMTSFSVNGWLSSWFF